GRPWRALTWGRQGLRPRSRGGGGFAGRESYRITLLSRVENYDAPRSEGPSKLKDSATSHSVTSDHRLYRQPCPRSRLQARSEERRVGKECRARRTEDTERRKRG